MNFWEYVFPIDKKYIICGQGKKENIGVTSYYL